MEGSQTLLLLAAAFLFTIGAKLLGVGELPRLVAKLLGVGELPRLVRLASKRRQRSDSREKTLARDAKGNPDAEARLASLQALQGDFPDRDLTRDVSRAALRDEAPAVRLAAAEFLGEEGWQTLRGLIASEPFASYTVRSRALHVIVERARLSAEGVAPTLRELATSGPGVAAEVRLKAILLLVEGAERLGDRERRTLQDLMAGNLPIPLEARSEAIRVLARCAPREISLPVFDQILDDSPVIQERSWAGIVGYAQEVSSPLWLQAAAACGSLRHTGATARLVAALGRLDPPSAEVVMTSLQAIGDPAAESALVKLLRSDDADAALAAARALGRIGTAAAVEPLRNRIDAVRSNVALKRAIREAIDVIQARLKGAEPGQLGLAEAADTQGRLTVSESAQEGRVSVSDPRREERVSEDR